MLPFSSSLVALRVRPPGEAPAQIRQRRDLWYVGAARMRARALGFLLPTCWEIEVTCAAAMLIVALYAAYELLVPRSPPAGADDLGLAQELDGADKYKGGSTGPSAYVVKLELLAAKNLIAANLNGTSDPYALITCGEEKRFRNWCPYKMGSSSPFGNF
ncbi:BAG-associated GRAM protein 1-like [Hordeum vulgare subsp. vulgare]|uniref:BAG-associated GRAM protein 1-like n=1 Tax=Hordeum vulgare subsp. vulgare TaxID=112509 RepID=UPI001D1A4C16|nr:BAG-associated GRAM protein 1-like [Hordeum vulgare subsp. vulgare]